MRSSRHRTASRQPTRQETTIPLLVHHGLLLAVHLAGAFLALAALALWPAEGSGPGIPRFVALFLTLSFAFSLTAYFTRLRDWLRERWPDRALTPYRLLLYCLAGGWIGVLVLAPPLEPGVISSAGAFSLTGFSLFTLAGRRLTGGGAQARRWLRRADLVLFQLICLLLFAELGLRGLAQVRPSVLFMSEIDTTAERLRQSRYPPGTVRHGFPVNSQGHYDSEFVPRRPDRSLVLSIGDSFSAGVVPHHYHFTTVAERELPGVDIYNMGLPSTGPPEYLHLLLAEGLALRPDAIVINLFIGNDLTYPLPASERSRAAARWLDRDNLLIVQVPRRLALLARLDREQRQALTESATANEKVLESLDEIRTAFPWVEDPSLEQPRLYIKTYLKIETHRMNLLRRQSPEEYHRRLEPLLEMRRAAAGTPILVMLIPDQFQVDGRLWARIRRPKATRADRMRSLWITNEWLEKNGFETLNLAPVLRNVGQLADGDRHLYHLRDTHWNARGNRMAGRALAERLRPLLLAATAE